MIAPILYLALALGPGEPMTVTRGPLVQTLVLDGKLSAADAEQARVPLAQNWDIQLKWLVDEGARVEIGDTIARFDNSGVLDNLDSLRGELQNLLSERSRKNADAASSLHQQRIAVRSAEIAVAKARLDAEIPAGIIEERTLQEHKLTLLRAEQGLEQAGAELETKEADHGSDLAMLDVQIQAKRDALARITAMAEQMEVRARTAGYVLHGTHPWEGRKLEPGDRVRATWVVASIPDMTSIEVEAWAGETDVNALTIGQRVDLALDAYPDQPFSGTVLEVSGRGEKRRGWGKEPVYRVRIGFDERRLDLMRPGMSIRTEIVLLETTDSLLVPIEAVAFRDGRYRVRPEGGDPITIEPLGIGISHIAVAADAGLREGMRLQPPGRRAEAGP